MKDLREHPSHLHALCCNALYAPSDWQELKRSRPCVKKGCRDVGLDFLLKTVPGHLPAMKTYEEVLYLYLPSICWLKTCRPFLSKMTNEARRRSRLWERLIAGTVLRCKARIRLRDRISFFVSEDYAKLAECSATFGGYTGSLQWTPGHVHSWSRRSAKQTRTLFFCTESPCLMQSLMWLSSRESFLSWVEKCCSHESFFAPGQVSIQYENILLWRGAQQEKWHVWCLSAWL